MQTSTRDHAAATAAQWLARNPIFMDTETTGLDTFDEICEVAIIDARGRVLLQTLVRPTISIPSKAYAIHGISTQDVQAAPGIRDLVKPLADLLMNRATIIYNAAFDDRLIYQSLRAAGLDVMRVPSPSLCAMHLYSQFFGELNHNKTDYRWHKLENAARQCGISVPTAHRAAADAETCRRLVQHMANKGKTAAAGGDALAPTQPTQPSLM